MPDRALKLRIGRGCVAADARLGTWTASRCDLRPFAARDGDEPLLSLSWEPAAGSNGLWLDEQNQARGMFHLSGSKLVASFSEGDAVAAELALRVLYCAAVARQGGLLIHASGASFGENAIAVAGPSGAGKSTLADLCQKEGAALLSDETLCLWPEGGVEGTPFRSEAQMPGTRAPSTLALLLSPTKAQREQLEPLDAAAATELLLSQSYRAPPLELSAAQALERASLIARRVRAARFHFPKAASAAIFLKSELHGRSGP